MKDSIRGLTTKEILLRKQQGKINASSNNDSKQIKLIIYRHLFTFFNFMNLVLAIMVILSGYFQNLLFMITVLCNGIIGFTQEYRSFCKRKQLRILNEEKIEAFRNKQWSFIAKEELVIDDIFRLQRGQQVPVDALLLDGYLQVNESILNGEERPLNKRKGDLLFAGSFVSAGKAVLRAEKVGNFTTAKQLEQQAIRHFPITSQLRKDLNRLLKIIAILLIPTGMLLYFSQQHLHSQEALLRTAASLIGMIPEGFILLSSIAFTLASFRLAQKNVLIQESDSLDALARCDTFCFDKTGTLTTGKFCLAQVIEYEPAAKELLASYLLAQNDNSEIANAILAHHSATSKHRFYEIEVFSSERKKSSAFCQKDYFEFGSFEFIDKIENQTVYEDLRSLTQQAYRVLAFAKNRKIICLIALQDVFRKHIVHTLQQLANRNIQLYFLSGDSVDTLKSIFRQLDFPVENIVDASSESFLAMNSNVIGRMDPFQKKQFISFLQKNNRTVAMIGDGVNDILALRQADFSISFASASDSAKSIAKMILVDNDFAHLLPSIKEGEYVLTHLQKSASLFLSKTFLALFLSAVSIFYWKEYPFHPIQFTLLSSSCIGIPAFLLGFEKNQKKIASHFFTEVISIAIPSALSMAITSLLSSFLNHQITSNIFLSIYFMHFLYLFICINLPLNRWHYVILGSMIASFLFGATYFSNLFQWQLLDYFDIILIFVFFVISVFLHKIMNIIIKIINNKKHS